MRLFIFFARLAAMKTLIAAVFFLASFSASAAGQEKPVLTKTQLILQFATLMKANQLDVRLDFSVDDVKKRMLSLVNDDKELTEDQKKLLRKAAEDATGRVAEQTKAAFEKSSELQSLGQKVVTDIYDKTFTESELKELIAFFQTPVGQKAAEFFSTSKSQIEKAFKEAFVIKMQTISQPIIDGEWEQLKQKIKAVKNNLAGGSE
jgi:hypothetical protein